MKGMTDQRKALKRLKKKQIVSEDISKVMVGKIEIEYTKYENR